ncbi:AglZ/HisF2 family acetamidino modification protein [Hydrogenophaga aquatica]
MNRPRIIPVLMIRDGGLVKTYKFADATYVGDPLNAVRIFNEKEVDELIVLDIDASKEGRGPNFEMLADIAEECFMPLCYGGGVSTIEEMRKLFALGIEKIAINSKIVSNIELIREASSEFGAQSVVASIDCKRKFLGSYAVHSHSNRPILEKNPVAFARILETSGAGEIMLTSVDRDGMREGFDLELCNSVASAVGIPVIACGGGGSLEHFRDLLKHTKVSAASGGSFFVHQGKHRAVLISYPAPELIERILES